MITEVQGLEGGPEQKQPSIHYVTIDTDESAKPLSATGHECLMTEPRLPFPSSNQH